MKEINFVTFVQDATARLENVLTNMQSEEDLSKVKKLGNYGLGIIDGLIDASNALVSTKNEDVTGDFGAWLYHMGAEVHRIVKEAEQEQKESLTEDKKQICKKLCGTLQLTRGNRDLEYITYDSEKEEAVMGRAFLIARTEGHRVQNQATRDTQNRAKSLGADVVKQWDATLDGATRPWHADADGQIRELDKPFNVKIGVLKSLG